MRCKISYIFLIVLLLCTVFSGCGSGLNKPHLYMEFDKAEYTVVAEEDTHGGFHGDGSYYLILDCSSNVEKALNIVREWKPIPLSANLSLIMYGGEKNGTTYGYKLAEEAHWPEIVHGYYKFVDEQSENPADDSGVLDRYSFNFEIAAYDTDTNMLYYYRLDT